MICLAAAAALLVQPAFAAQCGERLDSDGGRCRDCDLGSFAADALRDYTGADIAFFASGDLGITLPAGTIDEKAIEESFPADVPIVLCQTTASGIRAMLEQSVSHITLGPDECIDEAASAYDGYFCVSGLTFSYDASAPAGQRLYDLDLPEGDYTLAVSAQYGEGAPAGTVREAVRAYCEKLGQVTPPEGPRIRALGANENRIIGGYIPRSFVLILAAVAILFGAFSGGRYRRRMDTER